MSCQTQRKQWNKIVCLSSANKEMLDWCVFFPVVSVLQKQASLLCCKKHQWKMTWGDIHSMWSTNDPPTPIKVFKSAVLLVSCLCTWIASQCCMLSKTFIEMEYIDRTHDIQTFVEDYTKAKCFYTLTVSPPFLPAQIFQERILLQKSNTYGRWRMYSETDVCAPPTTRLSGHRR